MEEIKTLLNKDVLTSHEKKYSELLEIMGKIEQKSQYLVSVSGGFIGAFYFIIRTLTPDTAIAEKILLVLILLGLLITVAYCLRVVKTREITLTPNGKVVDEFVIDLLALDKIEENHLNNYYRDKMRMWEKAINKLQKPLEIKSKSLQAAQYFLSASIVLMVLFTVLKLFVFTEAN